MESESDLIVASELVRLNETNNSNAMDAVVCKRALHSACELGYNIETLHSKNYFTCNYLLAVIVILQVWFVGVMEISRPCQPDKLIPLLP